MIRELLKNNKIKVTPQRIQVLETIKELDDKATIKNIKNNNSNIDQSTIYRIIETFLNNNIIVKNINELEEIYYSLNEGHQHYIVCQKCHKKEKIDICPIYNLDLNGYELVNHKLELTGICNHCK